MNYQYIVFNGKLSQIQTNTPDNIIDSNAAPIHTIAHANFQHDQDTFVLSEDLLNINNLIKIKSLDPVQVPPNTNSELHQEVQVEIPKLGVANTNINQTNFLSKNLDQKTDVDQYTFLPIHSMLPESLLNINQVVQVQPSQITPTYLDVKLDDSNKQKKYLKRNYASKANNVVANIESGNTRQIDTTKSKIIPAKSRKIILKQSNVKSITANLDSINPLPVSLSVIQTKPLKNLIKQSDAIEVNCKNITPKKTFKKNKLKTATVNVASSKSKQVVGVNNLPVSQSIQSENKIMDTFVLSKDHLNINNLVKTKPLKTTTTAPSHSDTNLSNSRKRKFNIVNMEKGNTLHIGTTKSKINQAKSRKIVLKKSNPKNLGANHESKNPLSLSLSLIQTTPLKNQKKENDTIGVNSNSVTPKKPLGQFNLGTNVEANNLTVSQINLQSGNKIKKHSVKETHAEVKGSPHLPKFSIKPKNAVNRKVSVSSIGKSSVKTEKTEIKTTTDVGNDTNFAKIFVFQDENANSRRSISKTENGQIHEVSIVPDEKTTTDGNPTVNATIPAENNKPCCICGVDGHGIDMCSYIPIKNFISDKEVPSRARASLPDTLELRTLADNTTGAYAKQLIPAGTEFGAFCAKKEDSLNPLTSFPIKIFTEDNKVLHYLETVDENECNWMMFVQPGSYVEDQNLVCYQKDQDIYFATVKDISPGEMLRVWYAPFYASKMGVDLLGFERLVKQRKQEFEVLNNLVGKHQKIIPRNTWNCKFCYKLENSVILFAQHLSLHYRYIHQKRCECCKKKFKDNVKYFNHLKYSECSSTTTDKNIKENVPTMVNNEQIKKVINIHESSVVEAKNDTVGGPLLLSNIHSENSLLENPEIQTNDLDVVSESYNIGTETLTLSVDLMSDQNIEKNVNNKLEIDTKELTCDICLKKFKSLEAILRHIKGHTGRHCCGECKKVFVRSEGLQSHKCCRQYKFKCGQCSLLFYQAKYLRYHVERYHNNPLLCGKCGRRFLSSNSYQSHSCSGLPNDKKVKYRCMHCSKSFVHRESLHYHIKSVHNSVKSKTHSCDVCGETFQTRETYGRHKRLQHTEPSFDCKICDKKFARKDILKEHLMQLHGFGSTPSFCEICGNKYDTVQKLKRHKTRVHNKSKIKKNEKEKSRTCLLDVSKAFVCPICKKPLKLKGSLIRHIYRAHALDITVRRHKVKFIGATNKRLYNISKPKPFRQENGGFVCPYCPTVTKLTNSMRRHIKNKHPQNKPENLGQIKVKTTDDINAELDKMIADDDFMDDWNMKTTKKKMHTMDNLIESGEVLHDFVKEKTKHLDTVTLNLSEDISIIPVNSFKTSTNEKELYLSMPELID